MAAPDLDADMDRLAKSFTHYSPESRGHTTRYLNKLKRWIVAGVLGAAAGGALQLGAYFFMPELLEPAADLPQVTKGLDAKLEAEHKRLRNEVRLGY